MAKPLSDIGLVGLAVMGQNLALNIADHGFQISVFNRTTEKTDKFVAENPNTPGRRRRDEDGRGVRERRSRSRGRSSSSSRPGKGTDAVIDGLTPLLEKGDIVIDGGNSLWTDTIRREKAYGDKGLRFIGSGVSGGEEGARYGPSLMPGGEFQAWLELKPIWEAVAAKVDAKTGKPLLGGDARASRCSAECPARPTSAPNGAGHYVKMVHNGIEYGDMQMICEAYALMKGLLGLKPAEMSAIFAEWNKGILDSFLIEITTDILKQKDPVTKKPFVDVVLDTAGQKGTGKWTVDQRPRHGRPGPDDRRGGLRAVHLGDQGRARRGLQDPEGPVQEVPRIQEGAARRDPRRPLLLQDLQLRPGFPADARGREGIQVEAELRRDRPDLARAAASSAPPSCRRSRRPTRRIPTSRTCSSTPTSTRPSRRPRRTGAR